MSDLAITLQATTINPTLGDLELDPTGSNILLTDDVSYPAWRAVLQDVFIRLRFFYADWFLDPTQGIPYFRYVLTNNPDMKLIESIFRRVVSDTPGVDSISTFSLVFDRPSRVIYPSFVARLTSGETFSSADFGAFLVPV